jgi:hypothetical protein
MLTTPLLSFASTQSEDHRNDHPTPHHEDLDSYRARIEFAALAADLV